MQMCVHSVSDGAKAEENHEAQRASGRRNRVVTRLARDGFNEKKAFLANTPKR